MEERKYHQLWERVQEYLHSEYAEKIIVAVISFFSGLVTARGLVFGKYAPFGVAVAASVPKGGMWMAALGALVGYLVPSPVSIPARYAAALVAVLAIRWALSELKNISSHSLFAPVVTFLPLLLTGTTMVMINSSLRYTAALYVAEAFLGAGCAYFFTRTAGLLQNRRHEAVYDSADMAASMVTVCIFILALSSINVGGISIGRILTVLLVLYCSRTGGIAAGSVAGIAAGTIQGLSMSGLSYLSGAYGLGGLMAGVFAPMGKIATALAFIISHGVASLQVGDGQLAVTGAIEVAAATILYMALPKSRRITELFTLRKDTISGDALRGNVVMRLHHASDALTAVHSSVEEIAAKLAAVCAPDMQGVYNKSAERICAGCGKSTLCWRKYKDETVSNFGAITKTLKEKGKVDCADFQKEFLDRCGRAGEMKEEINKNYARHLVKEAAELRASQIREVVEAHFRTTADILGEMAGEFSMYERFDDEAAQRVSEILRENGITPIEVCCRIDKFDRMTVEAEVERHRQKRLNRGTFTKEVSAACGRVFSPPCVSSTEFTCRLQMCQRANYEVSRGFAQHTANNGTLCGDCAAVFYDGCGRLIALISDGMGTGGRAAVDGAMTAAMAENLLKAGIGFDSMLQVVNSALIAKSGEESLATLDIAAVDLFTGQAEFRKAGASGTVLKRGKHVEMIECASMPVGIMPEVAFTLTERELESGDMIVMFSDGVIAAGSEWLMDFLENSEPGTDPNLLAEQITERARKERDDGHEDDVSALVLMLE